ncbi:MAG: peptide transporter [Chitinivibrionales bacterium]|nr:peptide transporter [Chitinivibrionales bacterium]
MNEEKKKISRGDKELEEYRQLMEVPATFEDGFTWPSLIGALFVALMMVPGSIYMNLLAGVAIGPAAQWVTLILFIEVARRANKTLKNAEIYILYFLAGQATLLPFEGLLWNQFFAQSNAAQAWGIAEHIPSWFVPRNQEVLDKRTFFQAEWTVPLLLIMFSMFVTRLNNTVLGYGLFRLASDIEKLPFPKATIQAQGIMALSEEQNEEARNVYDSTDAQQREKNWRWRVFSIGGALGLVFGAIYLGLPTISGAMLGRAIQIFPIPFIDWTQETGSFLPAVPTGLSFDAVNLIMGMALPFFSMVGSFIGLIITFVLNPILYHQGILRTWKVGDDTIITGMKNNIDFYFSFTVGITLVIFFIGLWTTVNKVRQQAKEARAKNQGQKRRFNFDASIPEGRGDIKFPYIITSYIICVMAYIVVSGFLIDYQENIGVLIVMLFFGFVYTPLISYVTARLEGMTGDVVSIPLIREAAFILSGYRGVAVWFLPIPIANYGVVTVRYRQAELTGTKFWSKWKSIIILTPIILISTLFFSNFIWGLAPIPGPQYPFAETIWEFRAEMKCIMFSATMEGFSLFKKAFTPIYIAAGGVFAAIGFGLAHAFGWPIFVMYGLVRGLGGQTQPHVIVPQFIGALIGRYYFQKRLGLRWKQYIPVVAAGFSCGTGLLTTMTIGFTFLIKSVFKLPF